VAGSPQRPNCCRRRVFQNFRNSESRGEAIAVPVGLSANEALEDLAIDHARQRLYIANSGLNRIEIFYIQSRQLLPPLKVGQLPPSLAMAPDGSTLYVANTGAESVSIIDLDKLQVAGSVRFPALAFNSAAALMTLSVIAAGARGAQVIMNNRTIWKIVGTEAVPRRSVP
jgi:YVTN family beta-propeller protein